MNPTKHPGIFSAAAAHSFRVFPVRSKDKRPALMWSEFIDRSPTVEEIEKWDASDFNVGVICGGPSNVVVLDVDSDEAEAFIQSLNLPPTPTVKTAKGSHRYYRPPAVKLSNRVRIGGYDLDIRSDGGYVVGAGSTHETGVKYGWSISPDEVPYAEFPQVVLDLCAVGKSAPAVTSASAAEIEVPTEHGIGRFLALALREACTCVAKTTEGARNKILFVQAVRLAKHVAAADAEWDEFAEVLAMAGVAAGLDDAEIRCTLASAWSTGSPEPTDWIMIAKHHVYLAAQDRYYHVPSGELLRPAGFNGAFGRAHMGAEPFSTFLLNWGYVAKVQDITYEPRAPTGPIERDGLKFLNTFRPSGVTATPGDPSPFVEFMKYLVPTDFEREHLLKVIAFTVRAPGIKVRHAILLGSIVQGIGKSLVAEIWGRLLGTSNVRKTSSGEISSAFQGWIKENLLVVCEELNIGQGLAVYNELKDLITSDFRPINEKHLAVRQWPIYSTFLMLTNLRVPLLIEETDRRLFVLDSPAQRAPESYYTGLVAWLDENIGVVRSYLDQIDLTGFNPHAPPPMTDAKKALIKSSRNLLTQDVEFFLEQRTSGFDHDIVSLDEVSLAFERGVRPSPHKLGKALRELGAENLEQHWVDGRRVSLWAIRNVQYWANCSSAERVEEYKRQCGMLSGLPSCILVRHMRDWPLETEQAV